MDHISITIRKRLKHPEQKSIGGKSGNGEKDKIMVKTLSWSGVFGNILICEFSCCSTTYFNLF